MGALAVATMAGRIVQTSIHMLLPETNKTIAVRFSFFLLQVLTMNAMGILVVMAAGGKVG